MSAGLMSAPAVQPQGGAGFPSLLRPQGTANPLAGLPGTAPSVNGTPTSVANPYGTTASTAPVNPWSTPGALTQDPVLLAIHSLVSQNAAARSAGARLTARQGDRNDPSLTAYGQLQGQLGGQSDAASALTSASASRLNALAEQSWQEHMLRLKQQLDQQTNAANQPNPLAQLGGIAAGSILGPIGKGVGQNIADLFS